MCHLWQKCPLQSGVEETTIICLQTELSHLDCWGWALVFKVLPPRAALATCPSYSGCVCAWEGLGEDVFKEVGSEEKKKKGSFF